MTTLSTLIAAGQSPDCTDPVAKAIAAAYWTGLSAGQESAESKIRTKLASLPPVRYHGIQQATVRHLLADNPCAIKAPVCPDYLEIPSWEFDLAVTA